MMTQATYIEYLLSTPRNYTCTHLADHLPQVSHDQVNRFFRGAVRSRPASCVRWSCPCCTTRPRPFCLSTTACRTSVTAQALQPLHRSGQAAVFRGGPRPGDRHSRSIWCTAAARPGIFCPWTTASTPPSRTRRPRTRTFKACLLRSWRREKSKPARCSLMPGIAAATT